MAAEGSAQIQGSGKSRELYVASYNQTATETVILLHGAFSSNLEWEHVMPHLNDFHILIPDLPQHSSSREIGPFTLALAGEKVASLVRAQAHGGKAHFVGLSLGGFITQEVIRKYPDLVLSVFITGATPFTDFQKWLAARSGIIRWGLWAAHKIMLYDLTAWQYGLLPHAELKKQILVNNNNGVAKSVFDGLLEFGWDDAEEAAKQGKRVLVCAGGQQDDVSGTKRLGEIFKAGGPSGSKSQAFVVKKAIHGWSLQFPELLAQGIRAWIRREMLPDAFEPLSDL
ncbi:hypothetical protein HJFPF1_09704 [Paramyrothecium foliicola]|nr:hypothetical protein HJFPF1_09704 [Paramyrothecium foliicola]